MDTPEPSSPPRAVGIRPWRVLRHVGITYGLSLLGGFVIGIIGAMKEQPASMIAIAVSNILCSVAGFTLAGYFTPEKRWPHLFLVAGGLWLTGLVNLAIGFSFAQWLASGVIVVVAMGIGGGLAALLKKKPV